MIKKILLIIAISVCAMCAYAETTVYDLPPDYSLYNVQYKIKLDDSKWSNKIPVNMHVTPYILITKDGNITGFAGCNKFVGSVAINTKNHKFVVGKLASTRRACLDETSQALEVEFLKSLAEVTKYDILVEQLTLKDKNGYPILMFSGTKLPNK